MTAVLDTDFPAPAGVRAGRIRQRHPPGLSRLRRAEPARPVLRLYGVLRSARGRLRVPDRSPASRSRPARSRSGATRRCCRCPPTSPPSAPPIPGYTRLVDARHLADELGLKQLWVKDDSGNPTHSFKDRVVAVALSAARELGLQVLACPSTGNLANAVAAAAARAGIRSVVFVPENLEQQKIIASAVYDTTLIAVEGTLRRREQAGQRDRRRGGGLGVRQRQRPAVLRRGLQDAGLRDRRAARLAAARPDRHPGRVRLAADQDRQGLRRADQARPGRGQAVQDLRRPGHRLLAGRAGVPRRPRRGRAGQARTPSPSRWPSATRRTGRTCSTWSAGPAGSSPTSATTRSSRTSSGWPGPRASSPRPPAG